ncbi:MAG: rhombotarget lipoprotein [Steroidobacteraceae bacterium]
MKRLVVLFLAVSLTACAGLFGSSKREGVSSSLVDFLYPGGEQPPGQAVKVPNLELPLKVGLAFVSASGGRDQALNEAERMQMLEKVKASFTGRDYIDEIAVIPEAYLRTGRGFAALEQTARLYDLDVIALVSYDQVAHTAERTSSFLYWTIVGAYVVKGNKNDVQTFVDTAVFDVATKKLLFRAPGVSETKSSSTLVDLDRDLRASQRRGFEQAMADMTVNLDKELNVFKERIRTDQSVRVTHSPRYSGGGGAGGAGFLALLAGATLLSMRRARRQ